MAKPHAKPVAHHPQQLELSYQPPYPYDANWTPKIPLEPMADILYENNYHDNNNHHNNYNNTATK